MCRLRPGHQGRRACSSGIRRRARILLDTFRLTYAENSGAFLSLGEALPDQIRSIIFIGGIGLLSLAAVWAALFARGLSRRQVIALSLIASGGIGNWIDRLTNDGRVTDFLNVGIGNLRTGVFNVADMVLMAGVALYLLDASIRSRSAAR